MKKKKTKTWQNFTPQQEQFFKNYLDPRSDTWGNATQSAIKAGYTEDSASNITTIQWFKEVMEDNKLLQKALDNLWEFMGDDSNKNIQWDANKFVLSTIGKNKFSTRQEIVGKDGKDLIPDEITRTKSKELIKEYLGRDTKLK